jgi:nitroreductase
MEIYEAIEHRQSIRSFQEDKDIPQAQIEKILAAAVRAPSAGNVQPWYFVVIREEHLKKQLVTKARAQHFVVTAPIIIVACVNLAEAAASYGRRGVELYCLQDIAAAIENMLLAICAEGLGACWVGAFNEEGASKALDLPNHLRPVALIPIGYPAYSGRKTRRRPLNEVVEWR